MTAGFGKPMRTAVLLLVVSMFFVTLWLFVRRTEKSGAEQQAVAIPEAALNRAKDTNYVQRLTAMAQNQSRQSMELVRTQNRMTQCVMRVRAALPQGADAAALKVALEKDEAWGKLVTLEKSQQEEAQRLQAEAVSTIRQRMQVEAVMQKKQADLTARKAENGATK